jgi:hypothetical protein
VSQNTNSFLEIWELYRAISAIEENTCAVYVYVHKSKYTNLVKASILKKNFPSHDML